MSFLHKLYFIIQISYYIHMIPELYFQKVRRDEQGGKIKHSLAGIIVIGFFYFFAFRRIAVVLLTLHYFSEFFNHTFELIGVFDKDEKYSKCKFYLSMMAGHHFIFYSILANPNNDYIFNNFSPCPQQLHFPADRILNSGVVIPHLLHRHQQKQCNHGILGTLCLIHSWRIFNP